MTITETRSTTDAPEATSPPAPAPTGLAGLLGSGDHKVIGRLFIGFSLLFGLASVIAAALSRLGNLSGGGPLSDGVVFQVFTLSQIGLVFGFVAPLFIGLALYLVPLQVGAATIAFPRAAALSFWGWLLGSATLVGAYALDGGIGGARFRAIDLALLATVMVVVSLLLAAVCIATTVLTLRTVGMRLDRIPLFSWSMLVATGVWLLTWPVLIGNLVLVRVDFDHSALAYGSTDLHWPQLMWAFMVPQIFAVAIPLLGVIGDAVPTLAARRQGSRGVLLFAIGAFGALSLGAWAQPAQVGDIWSEPLFIAVTFLVVLPVLACVAGWVTVLRSGARKLAAPLFLGLTAVVLLLLAALAGALFSVEPLRLQEVGLGATGMPIAALGQAELVISAAVAGALAALFFWGPKITGGRLSDGLAALAALAVLAGGVAWGLAPVVVGFSGRFTGLADAADALTVVSALGAALVVAGIVIGALALLASIRRSGVGDDPWGTGQTLEWACASPPLRANFAELDPVTSPEPLLDSAGTTAEEDL